MTESDDIELIPESLIGEGWTRDHPMSIENWDPKRDVYMWLSIKDGSVIAVRDHYHEMKNTQRSGMGAILFDREWGKCHHGVGSASICHNCHAWYDQCLEFLEHLVVLASGSGSHFAPNEPELPRGDVEERVEHSSRLRGVTGMGDARVDEVSVERESVDDVSRKHSSKKTMADYEREWYWQGVRQNVLTFLTVPLVIYALFLLLDLTEHSVQNSTGLYGIPVIGLFFWVVSGLLESTEGKSGCSGAFFPALFVVLGIHSVSEYGLIVSVYLLLGFVALGLGNLLLDGRNKK